MMWSICNIAFIVQSLQMLEQNRHTVQRKNIDEQTKATQAALAAARSVMDSADLLLHNRALERKIESQAQEINLLKETLAAQTSSTAKAKDKADAKIAFLERSKVQILEDRANAERQALDVLQKKLKAESAERAAIEEQLARERKSSQSLLQRPLERCKVRHNGSGNLIS